MPDAPDPITSPPARDFQPYDACADGDVSGWMKPDDNGPADSSGHASGDFAGGPGPWRQT